MQSQVRDEVLRLQLGSKSVEVIIQEIQLSQAIFIEWKRKESKEYMPDLKKETTEKTLGKRGIEV